MVVRITFESWLSCRLCSVIWESQNYSEPCFHLYNGDNNPSLEGLILYMTGIWYVLSE